MIPFIGGVGTRTHSQFVFHTKHPRPFWGPSPNTSPLAALALFNFWPITDLLNLTNHRFVYVFWPITRQHKNTENSIKEAARTWRFSMLHYSLCTNDRRRTRYEISLLELLTVQPSNGNKNSIIIGLLCRHFYTTSSTHRVNTSMWA